MKRLMRNGVVALLVLYALASVYAAASAFWEPLGTIGLSTDYNAQVRRVAPRGPAALAGIVAGDRIDLSRVPFQERRYIAGLAARIPIGSAVHLRVLHDGVARDVRFTATPYEMTMADRSTLSLQCVASLLFTVVGAALILLRPTAATWGFGLYCLLELPTATYPFRLPSAATALVEIAFYDVVQNIGMLGLVVFALEFPKRRTTAWRERIRRGVPALFIVLSALTLYPDVANLVLGIGAGYENRFLQVCFGAVISLALYVLCDTYRHIVPSERERLRWVLIGFTLGLVTSYVGTTLLFSSLIPIDPPIWLTDLLVTVNVLLPLTVAHAVVRHRVFDINFVIGRALVFATLTTILALLFGLLDWLFGSVLEDFRLSRLAEAGISIGIAFAFDTFHKRTEVAVETIFFRKRRAAEARLDRLVRELPQARSIGAIESALIGEVVDALELTSAALYRLNRGVLTRSASFGWDDADCASLGDADLLVLSLRTRKAYIETAKLPWRRTDLPIGAAAPVIAFPMYSRADLAGIVLYGAHPGGADVDPTEIALLERLADSASIALDELEAERLRSENERQVSKITELQTRLDELRLARALSQP